MNEADIHDRLCEIYPVSRETYGRLKIYVDRLSAWQTKTNLVAQSTLNDIWERHIVDSLQCVSLKPEALHWLDLGSGGGLPGMVIASVMADRECSSVYLVESNRKKTAFLRQVNRQMESNATVLTDRIESIGALPHKPEIVTARALTALPDLLELASPWLLNGATGLFHKGREYGRELKDCDGLWSFDLIQHRSNTSADSVVLEISNLQRS